MNIYEVAGLIFIVGGVGGLVNCILNGSPRMLPGYDTDRVWHPGWTGSFVLSGAAAVLIWGIYGSSASFDLLGKMPFDGHLTVEQLLISVVIGMSGSRILTLEAQKLILRSQRDEEETAKERLLKISETILDRPKGD